MNDFKEGLAKSLMEKLFDRQFNKLDDILLFVLENLMTAEQTAHLGYEHNDREGKGEQENKRNGFRTIQANVPQLKGYELKIPRDRHGDFKPMVLELMKGEDADRSGLITELYCKGMTTRDIGDVVERIYGEKLSPSIVSKITQEFQDILDQWRKGKLYREYLVIYIDAIFLPVRRENVADEALYQVMGLRTDLRREILGVYQSPGENITQWEEIFRNLKFRGVEKVLLFVADGIKGLENKLREIFPDSHFQKCQVHKMRNLLNKVRSQDKELIVKDYKENVLRIADKEYTFDEAMKNLGDFIKRWKEKYPAIKNMFQPEETEYYFTYLKYPPEIRKMIYTTNWIENMNDKIKQTTRIRRSFPTPESAMKLVCLKLMDYEETVLLKYRVTSFLPALSELLERLEALYKIDGVGIPLREKVG